MKKHKQQNEKIKTKMNNRHKQQNKTVRTKNEKAQTTNKKGPHGLVVDHTRCSASAHPGRPPLFGARSPRFCIVFATFLPIRYG